MMKFQKFCSTECVTKYIGHNNRKIGQVTLEEIKTLRDKGLSYKEIADKKGFSKYAARANLINAYGYEAIEHQITHVDQALLEKMKALSLLGFSSRKIATKLQIGKSTAAKYLKQSSNPVPAPYPATKHKLSGKVDKAIFEEMKRLRYKGFTYTKIAAIVGLCRQTVKIHLKSYEPAITISHPNRKATATMIEEAKALRNEGLSYEQIGSKLGVVGKTVWKYLKSYKPIFPTTIST